MGLFLHQGQKDWLRETIKPNRKKNILVPSNRWGKMAPLTEPILTPHGWKTMGDMKIGEYAISQDGSATKVIGVYPQGKQKIYRLTFNDGSSSEAGGEHLWKVKTPVNRFSRNFNDNRYTRRKVKGKIKQYPNRNYGAWSAVTTNQLISQYGLNPKPHRRVEIPMVEAVQFPRREVPIEPYLLGVLLGDGHLGTGGIRITSADPEIFDGFSVRYKKVGKCYDYAVYGLKESIAGLGLLGLRSWEKFVPRDYLWNTIDVRLALLQGLMDTDGNIEQNGKIEYCTTSKKLKDDVVFLVQSFGGQARATERRNGFTYKGQKKVGRISYRLRIKIPVNPFRLKRKAIRFYKTKNTYNRILAKIEYIGEKEAQCIAVAHPSHLYVTKDFIVTHNTFITAVKHIWMCYYKIGITADTSTVKGAVYRTLNLAAHSEQARIEAQYIKNILSSNFVFNFDEQWLVNKCKIGDFLPADGIVESPNYVFAFKNGSAHISRTIGDDRGGAVQGGSYFFISYDECCRSYRLEDEIEPDILPRLIDTNGSLDLLSTPDKDSPSLQYYYELCEMGKDLRDGWFTKEGALSENAFITKDALKRAGENITDPQVRAQVLSGQFVFSGGRMFSGQAIRSIWDVNQKWETLPIILLSKNYQIGKPIVYGHKYILCADFARSESGDATAAYVLDYSLNPYEIVSGYRVTGMPISTQLQDIRILKQYYNARLIIDTNSLGGSIIRDLLSAERPESFDFKAKQKGEMLFILKKVLDDKRLKAPIPSVENTLQILRRELGAYKEDDARLSTDTVMALGIGCWAIESAPPARKTPIRMFKRI